jgi:hypothetical protein
VAGTSTLKPSSGKATRIHSTALDVATGEGDGATVGDGTGTAVGVLGGGVGVGVMMSDEQALTTETSNKLLKSTPSARAKRNLISLILFWVAGRHVDNHDKIVTNSDFNPGAAICLVLP